MRQQPPADGWENPDGHKSIEERGRPMFDAKGRPVTQAPPPDPAPELENMDLYGNPKVPDSDRRVAEIKRLLAEGQVAQAHATAGLVEEAQITSFPPDTLMDPAKIMDGYAPGEVVKAADMTPLIATPASAQRLADTLAEIARLAHSALDVDKAAFWAITLADIEKLAGQ